MSTVRPFDFQRNYTSMHNYMYDVAMPNMSKNAWAALSFIVRQTKGWQCIEAGLSYTDIMRGAKIKSSATVSRVIKELVELQYIAVRVSDDPWEPNSYALNADLEIETEYNPSDYEVRPAAKMKVVKPTSTSNFKADSTSNFEELYKEEEKEEERFVVAQNAQATEQQSLFEEPLPEQPKSKRGRKPNNEQSPEQLAAHQEYLARKREIEAIWVECIGVKPVHFGEIAKSSKALAEAGYTAEQVRDCFTHMLERKFWRDKFNAGEQIKLASVAGELPTWLQVRQKEAARKQAEQQRIEQELQQRRNASAAYTPEKRAAAAAAAQEMRQKMRQATAIAQPS